MNVCIVYTIFMYICMYINMYSLIIISSLSARTLSLFFLLSFSFSLSLHSCFQVSDGHVMKYIMESLKESHGPVMALLLGRNIKQRNCSWSAAIRRAGGLKNFCLNHADKIKWVKDLGGGKVELVKTTVVEAQVIILCKQYKLRPPLIR